MGTPRPITDEYQEVAPNTYRRYHQLHGLWSWVIFNRDSRGKLVSITHRIEQPREIVDAILDRNVAMQNSWKGRYGDDLITQTTSLPMAVHKQIMEQCGFKPGQGYDEKKFRQILNDKDNYKLKTVPGMI